jgi:ketosteroid isomerase-like protein
MTRFALAATFLLLTTPVFASDETDIMAVINKMNDAMNKNDAKAAASAYTANAAIIDEFPPHFWSGSNVFDTWNNDFASFAKQQGDSDPWVTTQKALHVSVAANRGYAVVPAVFTFKEHGKKMTEHGLWTFALEKAGGDWKIAGWAWARR